MLLVGKCRKAESVSIFEGYNMNKNTNVINNLVTKSRKILGDNLVGIYLHGSGAMGCFNPVTSDIDLLVIVEDTVSDTTKLQYMDMVVEQNKTAPAKGIELSVVKRDVCRNFIYPTPFELHFSNAHLSWYIAAPTDYVKKMKGVDLDLAAHFMITYHRGIALYGEEIKDVFSVVDEKSYFDSIWSDVCGAVEDIKDDPVYIILNLCRVLAFVQDKAILSKQEGGEWALQNTPENYGNLITSVLTAYRTDGQTCIDETSAVEFARYMLNRITTYITPEYKQ